MAFLIEKIVISASILSVVILFGAANSENTLFSAKASVKKYLNPENLFTCDSLQQLTAKKNIELEANVISRLSERTYYIKTGKCKILMDIAPKYWTGISISDTDRVRISGIYYPNKEMPYIKVTGILILIDLKK